MDRPRICLISTGGTIGMLRQHGALAPPRDPSAFLAIAPELEQIAEVTFVPLMNKDSVNVTPADWTAIAEAIYARMTPGHGFDGFVVTHGTDTMQYTAAALAFAFGPELSVPIVLTGSQTDASSVHGDARTNLVRAVLVAGGPIAEVVVVFGDQVFRGVRVQKRDRQRFAAFESPAIAPLAEIAAEIIVHPAARRRPQRDRSWSSAPEASPGPGSAPVGREPPRADFGAEIVQVMLVPGLRPENLMPLLEPGRIDGAILQTFGAGNVPDDGPLSFVPFIEAAVAAALPVLLTSQFPASSTIASPYLTGRRAIEAGAIATGNMTSSAAYVKFRWALAQISTEIAAGRLPAGDRLDEIRAWIGTPYVGELDAEPDTWQVPSRTRPPGPGVR